MFYRETLEAHGVVLIDGAVALCMAIGAADEVVFNVLVRAVRARNTANNDFVEFG